MNKYNLLLCFAHLLSFFSLLGQNNDTIINIHVKDYYFDLNKEIIIGDTIEEKSFLNTTLKIISYDFVGSMGIYEIGQDKTLLYKEYLGSGSIIASPESFWDSYTNETITSIHRFYEQKRSGVWKKWNNKGVLEEINIYSEDKLIRSIKL